MEKRVRLFLQSTLILLALGITVEVSAQPEVVTEVPVNSAGFITIADLVYFTAGDELWRTDGTDAGTIALKSGFTQPGSFTEFNGAAYFTDANNSELWKSDGTQSGTIRLHSSENNDLRILGQTNGNLFFRASDGATGLELYRTDGTTGGTMMVKDISPGPASSLRGIPSRVLGNQLIFSADNGTNGIELWKSDGSAAGTVMIKDINPGSEHSVVLGTGSFVYNNLFFFMAITDELGAEPWVSDGTAEGTHLLKDINPGAAPTRNIQFAIGNNGYLYFLILDDYDSGPASLWKTAGTDASTSFIKTLGEGAAGYTLYGFRVYENKVYFWNQVGGFDDLLWVTDGTSEGTRNIFSVETPEGNIHYFDVVNSHLLFTGSAQGFPTSFYRSDGTAAGTKAFREFNVFTIPGDVIKRIGVTTVGDFAFFADHDGPSNSGEVPDDPADYFHLFQTDGFTTQSMRTMYGVPTVGADNITDFNGKAIFTTYDDRNEGSGEPKRLWIYDPTAPSEPHASFTLVNADTDGDIQTINQNDVITKSESTNINIRYNPMETPGSVVFSINGVKARTENAPPYSLAGDVNGDYFTWEGAVPGSYDITATPYSESGGNGTAGTPHSVRFTIEEETSPCIASGSILREFWEGVSGSKVSDIPLHTAPTSTSQLSSFEGPTNSGTSYGARVSGFICPPATGSYTFWIASNDHSELWLSTDDNPANKVRIAFVEGATSPQQWTKFSSQKSAGISLNKGTRYYIEALHKQGAGTDNLAVGWQLPDGTLERPIPGSRLSPAAGTENIVPEVAITQPTDGDTFASPADVVIYADAFDWDGNVTKVEFFADGEKIGEDQTLDETFGYQYAWEDVPPGTYMLTATATDNAGGTGTSDPVTIKVTGEACAATGFITRDYWANVPGSHVSDIPVNSPPTSTSEIDIFEGPSNVGTNYASRIRGYICPPVTGNYTFWIASNDHSELWISTVENDPSAKQKIAFVEGATGPHEWTKFSSQRSDPVMLEQGKNYYIEALHKQGMGTDHIAVGWWVPNVGIQRPIPGRHLSPFEVNDAARMASGSEAPDEKALYSEINIYPNPVPTGNAELRMSGYEGVDEIIETQVEIINLTGEVVYQERIRCGGDCSTYLMHMNQQLVPGVYMVNMKTNGTRFSKRLLVK